MKHMKHTGLNAVMHLEAQAAHYGVIRTTDSDGRRYFLVTCGHCKRQQNTFNSTFDHVDEILNHFRKPGWIFEYDESPYCSTPHMREAKRAKQLAEREKRKVEEMNHKPSPPLPAPVTPSAAPPSIGPNPMIIIQVVTMLNDHFNKVTRLYEAGWSDERVAKEAATSLSLVVGYREEGYGKLAEDPEKTKFREGIKVIEDLQAQYAADIATRLDALKARMDTHWPSGHHKAAG